MLEFFLLSAHLLCLVDVFFQQTVDIHMSINCALLADLVLYPYEADFKQGLLKKGKEAMAINFYVPLYS